MTTRSDNTEIVAAPTRLQTGIAGLDTILFGGFVSNGLYIVQGAPGAGKTILSNQICFAHAAQGRRALYVTLLSEQHEKLLENLSRLSFFDAAKVAHEISYLSAFQLLERDGLAGLLTLLRREIVAHSATLLILDGLVAAEAYATTELELKKFIHELQILAMAADCTMFLLTSSGLGQDAALPRPEHTMVDGLIALYSIDHGWRTEREVHIRKFRGSDHLAGRHAMSITSDGIEIWPRIEALPLPASRQCRDPVPARLSTGIAGLDAMMQGGYPENSASVVLGPAGAGKTTLALQFLAGSTRAAPGLLLGFYEAPEQLLAQAAGVAPHLPGLVQDGVVGMQFHGAAEGLIDRVGHELLDTIRARNIRRLMIDGLLGFAAMTVQPDRLPQFYQALTSQLRALGVTTVSTAEVPDMARPLAQMPLNQLTPVAENLLLLRHVERRGQLQRLVSVVKLRGSGFDPSVRRFTIAAGGIVVVDDAGTGQANAAGSAADS